jgi:hypothetical protein
MTLKILQFFLLPFAMFRFFSFLDNSIIGIIFWSIYGYWYLDSLIALEVSYWFKGISIVLVVFWNGANNGNSSSFFALGFLIALAKFIFT